MQDSSTDEFWWPLPEQNIEFSCPVIQYEWWLFILIYNLFAFRWRKMCCLFKWWHCSKWCWLLCCTIFDNYMESQEFFSPWSKNRIQKYHRRTYKAHFGCAVSSAASCYKDSSKDIVRKIDFIMTDSTAHTLNKVIEKVKKISYENYFSFHWFYL